MSFDYGLRFLAAFLTSLASRLVSFGGGLILK